MGLNSLCRNRTPLTTIYYGRSTYYGNNLNIWGQLHVQASSLVVVVYCQGVFNVSDAREMQICWLNNSHQFYEILCRSVQRFFSIFFTRYHIALILARTNRSIDDFSYTQGGEYQKRFRQTVSAQVVAFLAVVTLIKDCQQNLEITQ